MRFVLTIMMCLCCFGAFASEQDTISVIQDTNIIVKDTIITEKKVGFKEKFMRSVGGVVVKAIGSLFQPDTTYIEPNHYNFQTQLQNKLSYEVYELTDNVGNSIRFVPKPSLKIGPSGGWSFIFLGVSIDVLHLKGKDNRKEFDMSFYTLPVGIDLFWRSSGDTYNIKGVNFASGVDGSAMANIPFGGIKSSVKGLNLYYIFSHKKFSYPAAFSQSTQQKRSHGSALAGIGYTRHSLTIDWEQLNSTMAEKLGQEVADGFTNGRTNEQITYTDLSLSGGYGYNWVFAKNWLFASSLSLAVSYKRSISNSDRWYEAIGHSVNFRDFKFSDLSLDGVGRFGIVWNNHRWFAGANTIVHMYNYSKSNFYTNNVFGAVNVYVGLNFGLKKQYKKPLP